jgi:hypothetical protein
MRIANINQVSNTFLYTVRRVKVRRMRKHDCIFIYIHTFKDIASIIHTPLIGNIHLSIGR